MATLSHDMIMSPYRAKNPLYGHWLRSHGVTESVKGLSLNSVFNNGSRAHIGDNTIEHTSAFQGKGQPYGSDKALHSAKVDTLVKRGIDLLVR